MYVPTAVRADHSAAFDHPSESARCFLTAPPRATSLSAANLAHLGRIDTFEPNVPAADKQRIAVDHPGSTGERELDIGPGDGDSQQKAQETCQHQGAENPSCSLH